MDRSELEFLNDSVRGTAWYVIYCFVSRKGAHTLNITESVGRRWLGTTFSGPRMGI